MLYLPVIYRAFSWTICSSRRRHVQNSAPGREFFWKQFATPGHSAWIWLSWHVRRSRRGTAIFKVSNTPPTQAYFVTYDGLRADWYLRLTAEGASAQRRTPEKRHHPIVRDGAPKGFRMTITTTTTQLFYAMIPCLKCGSARVATGAVTSSDSRAPPCFARRVSGFWLFA